MHQTGKGGIGSLVKRMMREETTKTRSVGSEVYKNQVRGRVPETCPRTQSDLTRRLYLYPYTE